jgi:hypothetical protein
MAFVKLGFVWLALFASTVAIACEHTNRLRCRTVVGELVSYRAEAIERAFGDLLGVMPDTISVKFVGPGDDEYQRFARRVAYDSESSTLVIPRQFLNARMPSPIHMSAYYWPFYENSLYREMFPLIHAVDNALWGAFLQEAARQRGLTWPHANCQSGDISEHLACEMLLGGVSEQLTTVRRPLFNTNRMDRYWPQDFAAFRAKVWRREDAQYQEVQRYGGLMLVKPLVDEFGVPLALYYIAQTPFGIEDDDLRASALRYQERARTWLEDFRAKRLSDPPATRQAHSESRAVQLGRSTSILRVSL